MATSNRVVLPTLGSESGRPPRAAANDVSKESESVRSAVARAREAQSRWCFVPPAERAALLGRAARTMLERRDEVVALVREECGKVGAEALFHEGLGPLDAVRAWSTVVRRATRRERVRLNPIGFPKKKAYVDHVPRGVVGVIAPWNFPVAGLYRSTLPALLTGNAIVIKPSEYTPKTSAWYAARLADVLPEDLVAVVQGGARTGEALIDAGIDACVFTGSPSTGEKVRVRCAERGIVASVEMGGKDAAIVLSDCDLARTVAGVTHWCLSNAGQACGAVEIAYVDERIADVFVAALAAAWKKLAVGTAPACDVGPLSNQRQFDVVVAHVEDARARGATVVCGGGPTGDGLCFAPTILDHCHAGMSVVADETFGPVLAVVRVEGAAEAIRLTNASRYGLGASIWTRDLARARRLAERLDVGVVTVNNHALTGAIPSLPWTGTRDTGTGVANSAHALSTFTRPKTTLIDGASAPEMYWMPYDEGFRRLSELLADAQIGRLREAWRIPLLLRKRVSRVREFFGMPR